MAAQSRLPLILTRPAPAARRFARQIRARMGAGAPRILVSPLMAPEFLAPGLPPFPWGGVIFTSETGVAALAQLTAARGGTAYCVGPRTARVARAAGWQGAVAMGGDAAAMVAALRAAPPSGLLLHVRGEDVAADLAGTLTEAGLQVAEVIGYAQRPRPLTASALRLLRGPDPVAVAVFSPRSARLLREQMPEGCAPLRVAAISAKAAAEMEALRPERLEIASAPDAAGMLDAVARLLDGAG